MTEITLALIIGILGSLLATGIFVAVSELFRRVVLPWYADKIYKGVRIDGSWEAVDVAEVSEGTIRQSLLLTQKGDVISGTYTHTSSGETDVYIISGVLRDQYFSAFATPQSNRHIDGLAILLKVTVKSGKQMLKGGVIYRSDECDNHVKAHLELVFTSRIH